MKRKKRRARPRRRKAKVTRTRTTTTRIVRSNPKRRSRKRTRSRKARPRRPKRAKASSSSSRRYTLVFANRRQARALIDSMRLPSLRRAWRRALKPYPGGGAYIALPAWRLASGTARKLAAAALTRLAYEAGRRRKRFAGVGPRVAIAPR